MQEAFYKDQQKVPEAKKISLECKISRDGGIPRPEIISG